ncbi:hypothetical protein LTS08_001574 [Lithohypha guttulata]|uniref:uncharacterized protein n=1 Tax=Lithohypha guttulata TaxID=1690604 RepID=UPI002DDF7D97|nr:hypothetical protein LTR51_003758 [Lithohypha guttulata]KAK5105297.1 hypothetical protein LTS08_001574 [Lithohypha guttulata]
MAYMLKEQGNQCFKDGQYKEAEDFYGQAISVRSNDPKLFQNRALARIRLSNWRGAEQDARKAVELDSQSMKAHFYLAQALLNLRHVGEAHREALQAYSICLATNDSSVEVVGQTVLKAKQAVWQAKETSRLREMNDTLATVEQTMEQQLRRDVADVEERFKSKTIGEMGRGEELQQLQDEFDERRRNVRSAFENSKDPESKERVVPDWMVDPISFEVMHDPVITPAGVSYERVGLLKHLKQSGLDPLTRKKLHPDALTPNVGLKQACAEFLERNGWAVDW